MYSDKTYLGQDVPSLIPKYIKCINLNSVSTYYYIVRICGDQNNLTNRYVKVALEAHE